MTSVTEKLCPKCGETRPANQFYKNSRTLSGLAVWCKPCSAAVDKARRAAETEEVRWRNALRSSFKITPEQWMEMFEAQGGVCKICKKPETHRSAKTKKVQRLAVDHNRKCCPGSKTCGKCVRGLLCFVCNTLLGKLDDDPEVLEEAARYLRTAPPVGDLRA